ncbi:MAG: DUF4214 domain-containing protein [Pseudomonadales bacterium]|nr:DUF4214 domain-containing protein [Pseudomonadales bacterium]
MKHEVQYTLTPSGERFDGVLGGVQWYASDPDTPLRLTFSFPDEDAEYIFDDDIGYSETYSPEPLQPGFQALPNDYKTLARKALFEISQIANIEFVETTDSPDVDIRIAVTSFEDNDVAAFAYFPYPIAESTENAPLTPMAFSGDIWLVDDWIHSPLYDSEFISVFSHEVGHALGLAHSHEGGEPDTPFATTTLPGAQDYYRYSAMSYNWLPEGHSESDAQYLTEAATLMPEDIAALHYLYGPTQDHDDDVYVLHAPYEWDLSGAYADFAESLNAAYHEYPSGYVSIVDAGGENTLIINQNNPLTLTLEPDSWLDTGGGYQLQGYRDPNLYLAEGTQIYRLITGAGDDQLTGTSNGNHIQSNGGNDHIWGGTGHDIIEAGSGDDVTYYRGGNDSILGGDGQDTLEIEATDSFGLYKFFTANDELRLLNLLTAEQIQLDSVETLNWGTITLGSAQLFADIKQYNAELIIPGDTPALAEASILSPGLEHGLATAEQAQLYRTYLGAMGRAPDQSGFEWWYETQQTLSLSGSIIAGYFIDSPEFIALADPSGDGSVSNPEFLAHVYTNVFGREADAEGYAWWLNELDSRVQSQADAFHLMAQSDEFVLLTAGNIYNWPLL